MLNTKQAQNVTLFTLIATVGIIVVLGIVVANGPTSIVDRSVFGIGAAAMFLVATLLFGLAMAAGWIWLKSEMISNKDELS